MEGGEERHPVVVGAGEERHLAPLEARVKVVAGAGEERRLALFEARSRRRWWALSWRWAAEVRAIALSEARVEEAAAEVSLQHSGKTVDLRTLSPRSLTVPTSVVEPPAILVKVDVGTPR